MGISGNRNCQRASRSALKDFTDDALTISDFEIPKKDKPPGTDGIPQILLKEMVEEISYPITNIFQTSLEPGRLPGDWLKTNLPPTKGFSV